MKAHKALQEIQVLMSVEEWSPDTLDGIAEILNKEGYPVSDVDEAKATYNPYKEGSLFLMSDGPSSIKIVQLQFYLGGGQYAFLPSNSSSKFTLGVEQIAKLLPVPTVYDVWGTDEGHGMIDRYTVFPAGEIETPKERYNYLGCSAGGRAFSQWGELKHSDVDDFDHLGREVPIHDLDVDTQRHIFIRLKD